ncbi:MAG: phosphatidylserine decarboxylase [Sulfurimonas sp.]|nr:phosphatidylserine decarboxylase [Sulfurimonas sp.]PHQ91107.1 MAG: phosphatidylserine decarboxylase [Sulfurimonas sp.]
MRNNLLPISREGWNYIAYSLGLFILSMLLGFTILAFVFFVSTALLSYLFRNPEREPGVFEENSVVSPVDAVVIAIQEINDAQYFYKLTLESRYLDVSVLRVPFSAKVESKEISHGARLCLKSSLAQKINENMSLVFKGKYENTMKIKHRVTQSFCGIKIDSMNERNVLQSRRYGVMINGISELYFPKNFRLNITIGDEVKASQTLLGYFSLK